MAILKPYFNNELLLDGIYPIMVGPDNFNATITVNSLSCQCYTETRTFSVSANTSSSEIISYNWYNNSVLTGGTLSAQTLTDSSFNVYCILTNTNGGTGTSNTITIDGCPTMTLTKTFSTPYYYYTADGEITGIFDYYESGAWVHGGSSANWIRFTSTTGISVIRFYFDGGQGYCGTLKTDGADPAGYLVGTYYVERAP